MAAFHPPVIRSFRIGSTLAASGEPKSAMQHKKK